MKNLPEKIYLNLNMTPQEVRETEDQDFHEATKTWEITWSEEKLSEHDPEYVLKDVFIEKALAYLNGKFYFNNLHYAVENNTFNCMEEMFEDFKKYMEE